MKIIIKKEKSCFALIQLFAILILFNSVIAFIVFVSLTNVVFEFLSVEDLLTICILLFLPLSFNLYILNYIFWQIRGYEIVEMTENTLSIKRIGKIFKDNSIIPLYKIEKIEEQEYQPIEFGTSIWINPFEFSKIIGETGGRIKVTYNAKAICYSFKIAIDFGLGLSKEDAHLYVQQMNKILLENCFFKKKM